MKQEQHIGTIKGLVILLITVGLILAAVFVLFHPWRSYGGITSQEKKTPQVTANASSATMTQKSSAPPTPIASKHFLNAKVEKSSSILKVSGATNLPDGSALDIVATRPYTTVEDNQNYEGTLGISQTTVQKGGYLVVLEFSDKKWYDPIANYYKLLNRETKLNQGKAYNFRNISDDVKVEISFSPKNQNENVLAIVGKNGEKLNGPDLYKNKSEGFHLLKATASIIIPFALPKKIE